MQLLPLVSLALAVLTLASPSRHHPVSLDIFGPQLTKHSWNSSPPEWTHLGSPPDNHSIRLRIGLKQSNIDSLIDHLYQVSDPDHTRYGQHLSKEEVENLVKPAPESVEHVENWLSAHELDIYSKECDMERSPAGDWIIINVPVRKAEKMLDTSYGIYQHKRDLTNRVVRSLSYSLPRSLHSHIDVITPTTMFGTMRAMKSTSFVQSSVSPVPASEGVEESGPSGFSVPASCNTKITPDCLARLYGTKGYVPKATKKNAIGIAGYLDEFANDADLQASILPLNLNLLININHNRQAFEKEFKPEAAGSGFTLVQLNGGGNNQSDPGVEANLDIQTTIGLTFPTPNIYYSTGGSPPFIPDDSTPTNTNEPYDKWVQGLLKQKKIPGVVSTSYDDDEQSVPPDFAA